MKKIQVGTLLAAMAFIVMGCSDVPPTSIHENDVIDLERSSDARSQNAPVRLTFEKAGVEPGVWEGTVHGAFEGELRTELMDYRETGQVVHVDFAWIITGTPGGEYDFVAHLSGILNLNTGAVVMTGRVVDGYLQGAQVHEEGQLVEPVNSAFQGYIRIMPATAGR
jgi:hypothetical protein